MSISRSVRNTILREFRTDLILVMGQVAAIIEDIKPAKDIVEDMVREAVKQLKLGYSFIDAPKSKL